MNVLLAIILFVALPALAQNVDPTKCRDKSIEILFLNGVLTSWGGAKSSKKQISELVEADDSSTRISPNGLDDICYKYIYNQTEGIYEQA